MNQQNPQNQFPEEGEGSIDIREIVENYTFYWKWFVFSILIFIAVAFIYLRYTQRIYSSKATILIEDEKKGGGMADMAIFDDLGLFGGSSNLDNEIEILKSRKITSSVAEKLKLNLKYLIHGSRTGFQTAELFDNSPIILNHVTNDTLLFNSRGKFELTLLDDHTFQFIEIDKKDFGKIKFGKEIQTSIGSVVIQKTAVFKPSYFNREIEIFISNIDDVTTSLQREISVSVVNKNSFVLALTTKGPVISKNNAILDELIHQHRIDQLADKNLVAEKTRDFIKERMEFINKELSDVDNQSLNFKKKNKLIDVSTDAQVLLEKANEIEKQIIETTIQSELTVYMNDFLQQHTDITTLLPSNLGINDQSVAEMIGTYNQLVLERNKLLLGSSEKNPSVSKLSSQLKGIKLSLDNSLDNIVSSLTIQLNALKKKSNLYTSKLASVPGYEKEYRDISRQQQIKETLYLYLLQKREENEIALSANVANTKVIDYAYSDGIPISPKKKIIYLGALLFGLLIPTIFIYVKDLLDNKVHSKKDLEKYNLPHVANIPKSKENDKLVILENPRSVLSESFRILRTNISFLLSEQKSKGNILFVTSTIAGEGKTFVSLNIAHSLALTGKKVVVVGLDLRAPKLLQYLDIPTNKKGVSDFIVNTELSLHNLTFQVPNTENLFLLPSGTTPPNPSELLMKDRLTLLFEELKREFDYVIVDTAPVSLVTDTLITAQIADATLYVVRANKLDKRMLEFPAKIYNEKKLNNMAVVLNAVDIQRGGGYGYGYGYGYGDDFEKSNKKRWWKRK